MKLSALYTGSWRRRHYTRLAKRRAKHLGFQALAASAIVYSSLSGAQDATRAALSPTLSLRQVLDASRKALDVVAAELAVVASQADVLAADHAPNPTLSAKVSSIDLVNGIGAGAIPNKRVDKGLGLDFVWERGGKRQLRTVTAERGVAAARAELDSVIWQQQAAAGNAYFDLVAAQAKLREIEAIAEHATNATQVAARRVKAGDLSEQDAARTQIEAERASAEVVSAGLEIERAALALQALIASEAKAEGLPRAIAEWLPLAGDAPSSSSEPLMNALLESRSDLRAAQARLSAAEAALAQARSQQSADITWGVGVDRYPGTSTRLVELRASMPIQGVFGAYNYQGEIARALAQVEQARGSVEKTRLLALTELRRLWHEERLTRERALRYESAISPRAESVAKSAEFAYTKGALSLTDLIDARRTLRATRIDALTARAEHSKALLAWQLRSQQFPEAKP